MEPFPSLSPAIETEGDLDEQARRSRRNARLSTIGSVVVSLALVGFGISFMVDSYRSLPASYKTLRARGVRTTARLDKCAPGIGGGNGVGCRLTLHFRGHSKTWDYPINSPQFDKYEIGAAVPVLVDPRNPGVVYTVNDVQHNVNTGSFGLFGLVFFALAAFPWIAILWWRRRFRRYMRGLDELYAPQLLDRGANSSGGDP